MTAVAVSLTDALGAQLRALLGHLGVIGQHDDRRNAYTTVNGADRSVLLPHRQRDPFLPGDRADLVRAVDVQGSGHTRGQLRKYLFRRADVNRLPGLVEDQHNILL